MNRSSSVVPRFNQTLKWVAIFVLSTGIAHAAPTSDVAPQAGSTFRDCPQCPQMTVIPAGHFLMGLSQQDEERDLKYVPPQFRTSPIPFLPLGVKDIMDGERPQHPVHIEHSFALGTYPVTREEFASFVQETAYDANGDACTQYKNHRYGRGHGKSWKDSGFSQTDRDPVVCVSKKDAEAYIAWLNTKAPSQSSANGGAPYRLPTEAEWEYAARAGTDTAYWWGDFIGSNNAVCDVCGSQWDNKGTAPVGSFRASLFGLYDMLGNVWEITADCWSRSYSEPPSYGGSKTAPICYSYVMRGGDWGADPWNLRSTSRGRTPPENRSNEIGFRVARNIFE